MIALAALLLVSLTPLESASQETPRTAEEHADQATESRSIAWYGTWEQGLAEAQRSGRPILLMSAAPRCHDVPGLW